MTEHAPGHDHRHRTSSTARLKIALGATVCVAVFELCGGVRAGSLALISDAVHVAMDAVALGIALAAAVQAKRPATNRQTYGFARIEILAALANGALLTAVTILIVVEAVKRLVHPALPAASLMAGVAAIGLAVNLGVAFVLWGGRRGDLNLRASLLHVAGDALGAIGVIAGGVLIAFTGAAWIDPLLSLLVAAIIIAGVARIVRDAGDVLLESTPGHAGVPLVRARIGRVEGVVGVHDLHVWTIGSESHALSAHVVLDDRKLSEASAILRSIDTAMRTDFAISHSTIQFECESCDPDTTIVCTQASRESLGVSTKF
ncbi:MAG TPA: cation diffusion facilitator family transporter [Candidatus Elarobacter sp.]|jgi:cobalt-zinc-cadmium efflux system protein|nr:cation diffusion facilitator family transporter [Candidatus Elarobacter sp.]